MNKIRKGDQVIVTTGRDKGKRGTVTQRVDADRIVVEGVNVVKKHGSVAVELDQRAVLAAHALGGSHDHGAVDLALLDATTRRCFLDADLDDVTNARITALGAAQHLDAHDGLGTRVVGHVEPRLHLDHVVLSPTSPLRLNRRSQSWARVWDEAVVAGCGVCRGKPQGRSLAV